MTDKHLAYIKDVRAAQDMMKILKNVFERKSTFAMLYIMIKWNKIKCSNGGELQKHFSNVDAVLREPEGAGATLDKNDKIWYLFINMQGKYEIVITAVLGNITMVFVKSKLLDAKLKFRVTENSNTAI